MSMRRAVSVALSYPTRSHDHTPIVRLEIMDAGSRELVFSGEFTAEEWCHISASRHTEIADGELSSNPERLGRTCVAQHTLLGQIEESEARAQAAQSLNGGVWQDARTWKSRRGWELRLRRWE